MPPLQPGDIVWVRSGNLHEDPATVIEVGCERDESSSDEATGSSGRPRDGIQVKFHVSNHSAVYSPGRVRPMTRKRKEPKDSVVPHDPDIATSEQPRRVLRSVVTPSPSPAALSDDKKPAAKRKHHVGTVQAARRRMKTTSSPHFEKSCIDMVEVLSKEDAPHVESQAGVEKKQALNDKNAKRSLSASSIKESTPLKAVLVKKPPQVQIKVEHDESDSEDSDESDDVDDPDDHQFTIDYAPSSRATCRRCDEVILKGSLRVSHVPLFRGKPGYRVYRHLHCALFSDEIETAEDVFGWKKLSAEDYEALVLRLEESRMETEKENEEISPDELVPQAFEGEVRRSPPGLTATLLPFQVEGHSWMYDQERNTQIGGGILSDEMGMGKTIQTLAVMLDNTPLLQHCKPGMKHPPSSQDIAERLREEELWSNALEQWKHEMEMNKISPKMRPKKLGGARAGTLVVCPVIALSQWKSEIEKFTAPGLFRVGIYHGPDRLKAMPAEMMCKYDVILTTYQVLEADFRKMVSPNKVTCPNCGGKFKIDKLRVHLKYFCGEGAERTEAQARQRRSSERPSDRRNRGKSKRNDSRKPPMTQESAKQIKTVVHSKKVKVPHTLEYDSDSELSVEKLSAVSRTAYRNSRLSAKKATLKMSASVKEWGEIKTKSNISSDSDQSSFGELDDSDETDSMIDEKAATERKKSVKGGLSTALQRAQEKQAQALANAKKTKNQSKGKTLKKKKFIDDSSESNDEENHDPMKDINLDELISEAMQGSSFSVLHSFCWWRVVLDEAHFIKSRASQTAAAAFALTSIHRWCLSGTPLQNRVGELYSLIRFLRIEPMAHYFCRQKDCTCKSIHYRMVNGKCLDCGHGAFSHFAYFNKHILNAIQRDGYTGDGRRAMFKLKNEVLDKYLLRRTKETRAEDMNLPPRIVRIRPVRLHPIEEDFYNGLYTETKASFDDYVAEGTLLNNYAHIFDLLTKMRQAVNHPYLIVYSKSNKSKLGGNTSENPVTDCDLCHEPPTDQIFSTCCRAGFCRSCVIDYISGSGGESTPCPSCRHPFTVDLNQEGSNVVIEETSVVVPASTKHASTSALKNMSHVANSSILRKINLADFSSSSKIEVLVQELVEMRRKRPGNKALVFSQFVNMLDLVRWRIFSDPDLADFGLGVRILHGGMDVKSRDATLKEFREDPKVNVLLMSLKAAGVALNLTVASECFLLDLWWNPAAEMQAIDRTHRLGQYKPIRAVRFVAEGTVEERVLQLQEKKRLVFDGTVGRDAGSLKMLTVDDMKAMFT